MGLEQFPKRGNSKVYDEDGSTQVPQDVREHKGVSKGTQLDWVSQSDEDFIRVYPNDEEEEDDEQDDTEDN